jgi:hypothetical protein
MKDTEKELMKNIFGYDMDKPDFVNEEGTKWWLDKGTTEYARKEDINGIALPDVTIFLIEDKKGWRTYLITQGQNSIFECQRLEGIGAHIDMMKTAIRYDKEEQA